MENRKIYKTISNINLVLLLLFLVSIVLMIVTPKISNCYSVIDNKIIGLTEETVNNYNCPDNTYQINNIIQFIFKFIYNVPIIFAFIISIFLLINKNKKLHVKEKIIPIIIIIITLLFKIIPLLIWFIE